MAKHPAPPRGSPPAALIAPMKTTPTSPCTRRRFLARAAAAGAIAGAPALLRGRNLNGRLNIAFIGAGGRARANLSELTRPPDGAPRKSAKGAEAFSGPHPDENVTLLCDINRLSLDAAGKEFPGARRLTDLRRVFDHANEFDAVVVSTAEHTHAFATYLALTHGKHVYCEKPLAYNIWETRLIQIGRAHV